MNRLFSNQYRLQKLIVAILLLIGLGTHTQFIGSRFAHQKSIILEKCLSTPASCVDKPLVMRVRIKYPPVGPVIAYPKLHGEYQLVYPVPLSGNFLGIQHGYVIDILGTYSSDGTFTITKFQRNDWVRPVKYAVSLLGLTLAITLLRRRYRFSSSRLLPLVDR